MSCFIIDEKTLTNVFHTLDLPEYSGNGGEYTLYATYYHTTYEDRQALRRKVWNLNHKAYRQRYSTNQSGYTPHNPNTIGVKLSPFQLLKSMECIAYQCDEYEPQPTELAKFFDIIGELRRAIVARTPEYNAAVWG